MQGSKTFYLGPPNLQAWAYKSSSFVWLTQFLSIYMLRNLNIWIGLHSSPNYLILSATERGWPLNVWPHEHLHVVVLIPNMWNLAPQLVVLFGQTHQLWLGGHELRDTPHLIILFQIGTLAGRSLFVTWFEPSRTIQQQKICFSTSQQLPTQTNFNTHTRYA